MRQIDSYKPAALFFALTLSACAVGPDYKEPETPMPADYTTAAASEYNFEKVDTEWWKSFSDPVLSSLIERAASGNKNIKMALARVDESRALANQSLLELFPGGQFKTSYEKNKTAAVRFPGFSQRGFEYELYSIGGDAQWEIDIFGGLRRQYESQDAAAEALWADFQDVERIVSSEVAHSYFSLRGYQNQLAVAQRNVSNQEETVKLVETRKDLGALPELDYARAKAQFVATRAAIPPLEAAVRVTIHRLSVLLGLQPAELAAELETPKPLPLYQGPVSLGKPEELLRRRPDIRKVERNLQSATAQVGVEVSDLFPKVTFNGTLGVEARSPDDWTRGGGTAYNFGPSIQWQILNFGRIRQRILAADARTAEALMQYESTVLGALEETENALVNYSKEKQRRAALVEAVDSSQRAFNLAKAQYEDGATDLLTVLDSQRTLLQNEGDLSRSETVLATNLIAVYKALAGGWKEGEIAVASAEKN